MAINLAGGRESGPNRLGGFCFWGFSFYFSIKATALMGDPLPSLMRSGSPK